MPDWDQIAAARGLKLSEDERLRLAQVLSELEAAFRPLAASIPLDTEPAVVFEASVEQAAPLGDGAPEEHA
jgi:hypothetical protein